MGHLRRINPELGDTVWVVNVASTQIESRHLTLNHYDYHRSFGAARLSPDDRRLYLASSGDNRYGIQCIDLATGKELWQTEPQSDEGLTTLAPTSPSPRMDGG